MPPFHRYADFLDPAEEGALLEWTLTQQTRFSPSKVLDGILDPDRRISVRLRDLGPTGSWFERKIVESAPRFFRDTGTAPFEIEELELEIAAHGDGAHFAAHTDIPIGASRSSLGNAPPDQPERLLSAVYYFHREPKRFSGGQLRLHRFGSNGKPGDYVDLEPERNSLVVFPSWITHEVRLVRCPGGAFEDYRFAVNVWLCATRR